MKKTAVAPEASAGSKLEQMYNDAIGRKWQEVEDKYIAKIEHSPYLRWEDPRKMLATPAPVSGVAMTGYLRPEKETVAMRAIKARVIARIPPGGARYQIHDVNTDYDLAKDVAKVQISMVDSQTFSAWAYVFEVDMYVLSSAKPGDWTVLDEQTDLALKELISTVVKAEVATQPNAKETQDDLSSKTQWTYVEKPRHVPVIRTSTSGSAEVYPLEDVA